MPHPRDKKSWCKKLRKQLRPQGSGSRNKSGLLPSPWEAPSGCLVQLSGERTLLWTAGDSKEAKKAARGRCCCRS